MENSIKNIFFILNKILDKSRVKGLKQSLQEKIEEQPFQNSLLKISNILKDLNIDTLFLQFPKNDISNIIDLPLPFISSLNYGDKDYCIIVNAINDETVSYTYEFGTYTETWEIFNFKWGRHVLLLFSEGNSININSKEKYTYIYQTMSLSIFYLTLLTVLVGFSFLIYTTTFSWVFLGVFWLKAIGLCLTILLIVYDYNNDNEVVNQTCKVFKSDCDELVKSKLIENIGWSDLGFIYFSGGFLAMLMSVSNLSIILPYLLLLSIATILFSFYSIWYQKIKIKKWCFFCLTSLFLFWVEFFILPKNSFNEASFGIYPLIILISCFGITTTILLLLKPILQKAQKVSILRKELYDIKYNEQVFQNLYETQDIKRVDDGLPINIFGSKENKYNITIVTNPICSPCSILHQKLKIYINGYYNNISLNIIFALSVNEKESISYKIAKRTINLLKHKGSEFALNAISEWYDLKEKNYDKWSKKFFIDHDYEHTDAILHSHENWCIANNVISTPTIFFNGRELPHQYNIEDLRFFIE